ncbi:hypothetical protein K466DRAFT_541359 [Polyporus arcularius HHB13444]|uniref:F-box domain-containing protein n=1 Tax=Polyporus arcularius HHB13444 TaxID=1314778 RepID=A0A5C3PQE8_9APHY|nr:hypothetical protein K466DRAFT_541359 [Polyporus arcularius HHB13444]
MPTRTLQLPDAVPNEIWECILGELPVKEHLKCMLVCRKFTEIAVRQRVRYESKLHDSVLVHRVDADVPLRVRFDILRRYRRLWEKLSFPMERGQELVRSVSSHIHSAPAPIFLPCGWLSMVDADGGLLFVRVPAMSSPKEPPNHKGWFFAHRLEASLLPDYDWYRFDPSQDVIVFLAESADGRCPDVHIRSLTTGLQHPLAQYPILEKSDEPIFDPSSFRIHADLCAVLARKDPAVEGERVLHVWDWQTGQLCLVQSGFHAWGDVISLIGDRTLLVAHDECLELHAIDDDNDVHTCTLELPRFQEESLQIWTTVSQPYTQAEPGRAFACDPASEIVVINMVRDRGRGQHLQTKTSILLAIRVASLRVHASAAMDGVTEPVPWEAWGPKCSRFFQVSETCSWEAPTTFGSRALIPYYDDAPVLALLDFDVDATHAGTPAYATSPEWSASLLKAPALEDYSQWFEEDCKLVRSDVPCRIRCRRMPNLHAQLVGASLFENGFLLKVADPYQCDYVTMSLDM